MTRWLCSLQPCVSRTCGASNVSGTLVQTASVGRPVQSVLVEDKAVPFTTLCKCISRDPFLVPRWPSVLCSSMRVRCSQAGQPGTCSIYLPRYSYKKKPPTTSPPSVHTPFCRNTSEHMFRVSRSRSTSQQLLHPKKRKTSKHPPSRSPHSPGPRRPKPPASSRHSPEIPSL